MHSSKKLLSKIMGSCIALDFILCYHQFAGGGCTPSALANYLAKAVPVRERGGFFVFGTVARILVTKLQICDCLQKVLYSVQL